MVALSWRPTARGCRSRKFNGGPVSVPKLRCGPISRRPRRWSALLNARNVRGTGSEAAPHSTRWHWMAEAPRAPVGVPRVTYPGRSPPPSPPPFGGEWGGPRSQPTRGLGWLPFFSHGRINRGTVESPSMAPHPEKQIIIYVECVCSTSFSRKALLMNIDNA